MQRIIAFIIAVCYLCFSTGFTLHEHYCMGKHVGTTFVSKGDTHKCDHCGMKQTASGNGCCKDKQKIVKGKVEVTTAKAFLLNPTLDAVTAPQVLFYERPADITMPADKDIPGKPHGPPILGAMRLHVRHCVFLI